MRLKYRKCFDKRVAVIGAAMISVFISWKLYAGEPNLQKPQIYSAGQDVTGWVMSEKLDGIRGYWDGSKLVTRKGTALNPPPWFTKNFPPFELDGELYSKREEFEFIQSVVLDDQPGKGWDKITYHIFEVPNQPGDFFQRLEKAKTWFAAHPNPSVKIIAQFPVTSMSDLDNFIKKMARLGAEGVIVKNPEKAYHTGRSPHILKIKKARDMEGKVIAINPGKGEYTGAMGSLTLRLENGIEFKLGTGFTDENRQHPPPIGSKVTFKYYGFTKKGIPKFASFLRVRKD